MEAEAPLMEFEKDHTARLMVQQANEDYGITFFTPIDVLFGFIAGGLNTLPKEGYLSQCGNDSLVARGYVNDMIGDWENRNFEQFVDNFAKFLYMVNDTTQHCYLGAKERYQESQESEEGFNFLQIV